MDINLQPIPTRTWDKDSILNDPEKRQMDYDRKRKESPEIVNERINYMWFHFLQLCLELERLGYAVEKKGSDRKVISSKPVSVDRNVYREWDLESLDGLKFHQWYKQMGKNLLFTVGGFKNSGKPQYSTLVKKFNVFIEYMRGDKSSYEKDMDLCEKIIKEDEFQRERFERLERTDSGTGERLKRGEYEM